MTQFSSFYIMITALSQCSWNVPITLFLLQQMKYWIYRCLTDNCFCLLHILFVFATCCQQFGGNICQLTIILWSLPSLNVPNMFRLLGCYAILNLQNVSQVVASYIQCQPIFSIKTYSPNCWQHITSTIIHFQKCTFLNLVPEGHTETIQLTFITQVLAWYIQYQHMLRCHEMRTMVRRTPKN